jgi:hypothetical protein
MMTVETKIEHLAACERPLKSLGPWFEIPAPSDILLEDLSGRMFKFERHRSSPEALDMVVKNLDRLRRSFTVCSSKLGDTINVPIFREGGVMGNIQFVRIG